MRIHTNDFKETIKRYGRNIQGKITYYPSYDLVSESDDNILTEADLQIISEQANYDEPIEISEEDIFSISIIKNGDLLQSLMKEFDFETKEELNIGSVVNPQFGLLVDEDYEYLDYGNYIINSKEFNMDTETWSYVCYDKMLFSMVKYRGLSNVEYPITIKQFINNLCNKVGLEFEDSEFVNQDQLIYEDLYRNRNVTYRDIFDEISKIVAGNLLINDNDKLEVGYPSKASYSENASGSDISIEAVEEPILDIKLEGDTQQEGTPTPVNPQDVEVVTGEQNIIISQNGNIQNYPISLGNIELCKIGSSQDYIYENNGDWYLHKEIEKEILPSSDTANRVWTKSGVNKNNTYIYTFRDRYLKVGSAVYSNMFLEYDAVYLTNNNIYGCAYNTTGDGYPSIRVGMTLSGVSTVANFRTWLSTNQPTFYYELATPTDTKITETSLIQQLDNLKNATLFNGVNNISVDGDLPSILNLDYISEYENINEDYLKDTNVRMSERIGVINSVAILDTDNDLQYIAEDTQSIKENEMTRITITDNLIAMNGETQEIADNILNKLNGLYYYANDLQTTGVCYYDFLDMFNVEARGNIYQCLLLNNEITITQGIEEHIFTERFEEVETSSNEYTTSVISNKAVQFKINRQEAEIEARVEKDGIISAINLSPEEIQIQGDKLSLEGKNINLTGDNIKITGENLDIDSNGTITLTDNSADDTQERKIASYIVKSSYDSEYQGETAHVGYTHEVYANGRQNEYENNNNITGSSGYGHYFGGITENLYRYPSTTWYMKSDDYVAGYTEGTYNSMSVGLNSITSMQLSNGTYSYPLTITATGNITCVSVTQTSKEENKKNFERLTNAKDILNQVDIYKYNFKDEDDNVKKSIGFVIGDDFNYSEEITSENNDGANIYSMVSVLWQVVKEQQEEINQLKEMIKNGKY